MQSGGRTVWEHGIHWNSPKMAKEKRREELYVTVPSLFRCPISMDVMRSPVSLCTGVTYDRSSIEKWLELGHNTCPATMQTLPSTHTTPNLTLRRLINLWLTHADLGRLSPSSSVISKKQAADLSQGTFDSESLSKLIGFMKASEENLRFVALSNDSVSKFVETFCKSDEIRICESIVEILDLISLENGMAERLNELILETSNGLPSFSIVVQKGSTESKINSAKLLELIAINPESRRKIADEHGLLHGLYILSTSDSNSSAAEAGLSALLALSTTRPAKKELIRFGIVRTVEKILTRYAVGGVIEKALAMLASVATCPEGRVAIAGEHGCVGEVVKRLMKSSGAATEHGVTVIWSVCCVGRDRGVQEVVARGNGLTKVLLVMQSDCSVGTRQMCGDLVKVLRAKNAKSNLAPYDTKTTHITPY